MLDGKLVVSNEFQINIGGEILEVKAPAGATSANQK